MKNTPKKENFPEWVQVPSLYDELIQYDQEKFLPWYFFDWENLLYRWNGMKERYPDRVLYPFARHDNCDDVACWEKGKEGKVVIIHDYASPGFESRHEFDYFDEFYEYILSDIERD